LSTLRLHIDYDYQFYLIGLSCHLKDYRLCWSINRYLGLGLKRRDDHILDISGAVGRFPFFQSNLNENSGEPVFSLVANRSESGLLIAEHKEYDYWLLATNLLSDEDKNMLLKGVQKLREILAASPIEAGKLRSRQNLIVT
jgi:hypothetical protein